MNKARIEAEKNGKALDLVESIKNDGIEKSELVLFHIFKKEIQGINTIKTNPITG